jgi:phospholipid/cholesterol/gamma-HCH transport system substrate-binding protein
MLTRFIRIQLTIFAVVSVIGLTVMVFTYLQAPTLLGIGRITVKLELPAAGGVYPFSNVTYRGVQIGKVTDVKVIGAQHVEATLSLDTSPEIPADLVAQVRSVSAVGEQYVDLQPHDESPPYLRNGSVIAMRNTTIPQAVGPMLNQLSALVGSIPKDKLSALLDESFQAFNGAGYDFGSLLDSSAKVTGDLNGVADQTRTLIDDSGPLLDSQAQSIDAIKLWAHSLSGITEQVSHDDPQVRTLLKTGPGAANEVSRLLDQLKPTLPVLLANLTTIGQIAVTYRPSLEQLLVLLPPNIAAAQAVSPTNNPTGFALGGFPLTAGDPPGCSAGFLPPSQWRSPTDTTEVDTPDGLYCKLPQDSPIAVRGARNYPCMGHPGKRAPTVEICDSDQPFVPLVMHQHALGPYPLDPNLIGQGIPPDDRIDFGDRLHAPAEGTPMPPGASPPSAPAEVSPPAPTETPPPPPAPIPPPDGDAAIPAAAPSSFSANRSGGGPAVTVAQYDPRTGKYMDSGGQLYRQSNLADTGTPKAWTDLVLGAQ